jgi:AraC-like DNA-binding protein/ligand-binding sensor protein
MNKTDAILEAIQDSDFYREYERAFNDATGLPLVLREVETWSAPFSGKRNENKFCAMMAQRNASCAACLNMQERLTKASVEGTAVQRCHFGMTDIAVPVKLGNDRIAVLATGQVLTHPPGEIQFAQVEAAMKKLGISGDLAKALEAYKQTKVMSRAQLAGFIKMLENFAEHLSVRTNQIALRQANAEPIAIVRAKAYIRENLQEDITLADVAKASFTSTFYICKLFKRHTGMNFTEYVSRLRVERAKESLGNPNLRISEIAFDVGFQSLTHFNRIFRRIVGEAPTVFRDKLRFKLAA